MAKATSKTAKPLRSTTSDRCSLRGLLGHAVEEDQCRDQKRSASNPDHPGDDADDRAQDEATGEGEWSHSFAFSGLFHGMRPSTEAIMQLSLTPAYTRPAPTRAAPRKNFFDVRRPRPKNVSTRAPAVTRTWRSIDHGLFAATVSCLPLFVHACTPPSRTVSEVNPLPARIFRASSARRPLRQTRVSGSERSQPSLALSSVPSGTSTEPSICPSANSGYSRTSIKRASICASEKSISTICLY